MWSDARYRRKENTARLWIVSALQVGTIAAARLPGPGHLQRMVKKKVKQSHYRPVAQRVPGS
jgi:hypothetical protein